MKKSKTYKILVANGAGYGNTGDEAQIDYSLAYLTKKYPLYQIVGLTPNVSYSKSIHPEFFWEYASRVLLSDQKRKGGCFTFKSSWTKIRFLFRSMIILLNAYLIKHDFPTIFINSDKSKFLFELANAELLVFSGGGYLTGATLSRLWDGVILCKLCEIFGIPVVMSGQTIGVWRNKFNQRLAKWGFKKVKVITTRDEEYSINDLKQIGICGEHIFPTCDDALFCKKYDKRCIDTENYITVNFHYWKMDEKTKGEIIDKLHAIISFICDTTSFNLIFIPMHASDKDSFDDYIKKYPNNRFTCFSYDYDFKKVRRVIADSCACITMKHHPIIFAMGENIPVISMAYSDYYIHKNQGALAQYHMDKYSVNLEHNDCIEKFKILFEDMGNSLESIKATIAQRKEVLKTRQDKFYSLVDNILQKTVGI